jgi:superfamily II DNA or RNA helicase
MSIGTNSMQLRPHQKEALDVMGKKSIGIIVVPTGGGKTFIAITHAMRQFEAGDKTIVVVAPRLMLARQLSAEFTEHITNASVMHVHSGNDLPYFTTTKSNQIFTWCNNTRGNKLIITTYHSLHRIQEAGISVDSIYFDEAHNSIKRNFFGSTKHFALTSNHCYFFTATPKYSSTGKKYGMNDSIFGGIIYNVPAPRLVNNGSILPPKINAIPIGTFREKGEEAAERDCMTLLDTLYNEDHMEKVLIAAPNTKVLIRMLATTDFMNEVHSMGYDLLWITSKHGAFHNNSKITREEFFNLVREYGADPNRKFIVMHYSILSEGISVPGLTSLVLMRQMNVIEMCQSVGRVIRLHLDDIKRIEEGTLVPGKLQDYTKSFGLVHVPVYSNVGISTVKRLQSVVDTVFVQGQPAISTIKR